MSKKPSAQAISAVIGLIMVASVILGMIGLNTTSTITDPLTNSDPFATPLPTPVTFPVSPSGEVVESAGTYVHPTGIFQIMSPQGWTPTPNTQPLFASVTFNQGPVGVIEATARQYDIAQDIANLDAAYNVDALAMSWSNYDSWAQTRRDIVDGRLEIDFDLVFGVQNYVARQISWLYADNNLWELSLRLILPGDDPALLDQLQAAIIPTYQLLPDSLGAPMEWIAYIDQVWGFAMRFPEGWTVSDGGPGLTATLTDSSGRGVVVLTSEADTAIEGEDTATAWVQRVRPGAEILGVQPVERASGSGYGVSYQYPDPDGGRRSGLAILLNGTDGRLAAANLRLSGTQVDLLDVEASAAQQEILQAMQTFALLPAAETGPEPDSATPETVEPTTES